MGEQSKKQHSARKIIFTIAIILGFTTGFFLLEILIPTSQIPSKDAEYPGIVAFNHPQSVEINKILTINITYQFGNSKSNLHIYEKLNPLTRTLELILWRPSGFYFCVWELGYVSYNVSFPRTGLWNIEINTDYMGPRSNISVFK